MSMGYQGRPVVDFRPQGEHQWTQDAACAEDGVGPMFPHEADAQGIEYAKSICARCPVVGTCLETALENNERFGVWGGLTEAERYALRRKRAAQTARAARKTPSVPPRQPNQKHRKDIDGADTVQLDASAQKLLGPSQAVTSRAPVKPRDSVFSRPAIG